jgi:hypothetical protein
MKKKQNQPWWVTYNLFVQTESRWGGGPLYRCRLSFHQNQKQKQFIIIGGKRNLSISAAGSFYSVAIFKNKNKSSNTIIQRTCDGMDPRNSSK